MKKNLFTIGFITLTILDGYSYIINVYSRTTNNGGVNGYNFTHKVTYDDGLFVKMTYIECRNPGNEECPTSISPSDGHDNIDMANINELVQIADLAISNSNNSGTSIKVVNIIGTNQYRKYTVTWYINAIGEMKTTVTREDYTI